MNIKKKLLSAGMALSFCVASTSLVYAAAGETNSTGGAILTITDTAGGTGETLTMSMSPGVVINAETTDNAFALSTANANANTTSRIEYAVWSVFSGYYMQSNTDDTVPFTTADMLYDGTTGDPSSTTSPFTGTWTAIGATN